jgi:glycosyltransferase involved in cell wall biosynthesis
LSHAFFLVPDLIDDGVNGILVSAGDIRAPAREIAGLVEDPGKRERLGENARSRMRVQYSSAGMIDAIHSFYEEVVERRP